MNQFFLRRKRNWSKILSNTLHIVCFPRRITSRAHIQIFHIRIIISNVQDFGFLGQVFTCWSRHMVCFASLIRTLHIINPGNRWIEFGIFIDNMIKLLFFVFELCIQYTNILRSQSLILVAAISTIICQRISIFFIDADIVHVIANFAKFHRDVTGIWYIECWYYLFMFLLSRFQFLVGHKRSWNLRPLPFWRILCNNFENIIKKINLQMTHRNAEKHGFSTENWTVFFEINWEYSFIYKQYEL